MDVWLFFNIKSNAKHAPDVRQELTAEASRLSSKLPCQAFPLITYGANDSSLLVVTDASTVMECREHVRRLIRRLSSEGNVWLKGAGHLVLWPREEDEDAAAAILDRLQKEGTCLSLTFVKLRSFVDTSQTPVVMRDDVIGYLRAAMAEGFPADGVLFATLSSFGWADFLVAAVADTVAQPLKLAMALRGHWSVRSTGTYFGMRDGASKNLPTGAVAQIRCSFKSGKVYGDCLSLPEDKQTNPQWRSAVGRFDVISGFIPLSEVGAVVGGLGQFHDESEKGVVEFNTVLHPDPESQRDVVQFIARRQPPAAVRPLARRVKVRPNIIEARERLAELLPEAVKRGLVDAKVADEAGEVAEFIQVSCGEPEVHDHFVDVVLSFHSFVDALQGQLAILGLELPKELPPLIPSSLGREGAATHGSPEWCTRRAMLHREVSWAINFFYRSALHRHRGGLDSLFYPQLGQTIARSSLHRLLAVADEIAYAVQPKADLWKQCLGWNGHVCLSERCDARSYRLTVYNIVSIAYIGSTALLRDLPILTAILVHEVGGHVTHELLRDVTTRRVPPYDAWPPVLRHYWDDVVVLGQAFAWEFSRELALAQRDQSGRAFAFGQRNALIAELWSDCYQLRVIGPPDRWVELALALMSDQALLFDRPEHDFIRARLLGTFLAAHREELLQDIVKGPLRPPACRYDFVDSGGQRCRGTRTCQVAETWPASPQTNYAVADWLRDKLEQQLRKGERLGHLLRSISRWLGTDDAGTTLRGIFAAVNLIRQAQDVLDIPAAADEGQRQYPETVALQDDESVRDACFRQHLRRLWDHIGAEAPRAETLKLFDRLADIASVNRSANWRDDGGGPESSLRTKK